MSEVIKDNILRYTAVFEPDTETGGFVVTIPALPGCISEGDTFEEARKNIEEAASLYIEVMQEAQDEIPREEQGVIVAPVHIPT